MVVHLSEACLSVKKFDEAEELIKQAIDSHSVNVQEEDLDSYIIRYKITLAKIHVGRLNFQEAE